jgi:hypothetical protein
MLYRTLHYLFLGLATRRVIINMYVQITNSQDSLLKLGLICIELIYSGVRSQSRADEIGLWSLVGVRGDGLECYCLYAVFHRRSRSYSDRGRDHSMELLHGILVGCCFKISRSWRNFFAVLFEQF